MSTPAELELKLQREREGRCGNCGVDTHETAVAEDGRVVRRGPGLSILGEVHRGRCLFCYPFDTSNCPPDLTPALRDVGVGGEDTDDDEDDADDALCRRTPLSGRMVLSSGSGSKRGKRGSGGARSKARNGEVDEADENRSKGREPCSGQKQKSSPRKAKKSSYNSRENDTDAVSMGSTDDREDFCSAASPLLNNKRKSGISSVSMSPDSKKTKSQVSIDDFVRSVIAEAKARPQSASLQDKSIEKLRTIVESEDDKREWVGAIVDAGGIEMILEAMKNHKTKAAVQFEGCKMLAIVAYYLGDDRKVASAGGIAAVLRSMKSTKSGKIAEAGMEALVNLSTKPDLRAQIIAEGGLGVVSATLATKHRNAKLQAEGCNFFLNLASRGDVENAVKISDAGAIPLIVAAVKNHPNYEGVVQTACEALQNLAVSNEVRGNITDSGGIDMIMDLMDHEVENLQESILDLLKNLTTDHSAIQLEVALAGGIAKTISLMKEFPENVTLTEKACVVLQNLSSQNESADLIVKYEGVTEVVVAMKKHKKCAKLQEEACLLLWKMCSIPSVVQFLQLDEMQDILKLAASRFPQNCGATVNEIQLRIGSSST